MNLVWQNCMKSENVIGKHLEMLADEPRLAELYEKISQSIHRLA